VNITKGYEAMVTKSVLERHVSSGFCQYESQRDSKVVPEWLNAALGTASYDRVIKLLDEIRQFESRTVRWARFGRPNSAQPHVTIDARKLNRRYASLNQMLEGYHFSPELRLRLVERQWMLSMCAAPIEGEYVFHRVFDRLNKSLGMRYHSVAAISEADVVLHVLNLAAAAELERVKQCDNCFKWFYAERSHQRFCPGGQCRLAKYRHSPKYKEYRRQYMRRRRAQEAAEQPTQFAKRKGR
jgi:hypothetical protein